MNVAMHMARTHLVQPFSRPVSNRSHLMTPLPHLRHMGNTQAHFLQLFSARMALRQQGVETGFLVFASAGQVKYYAESYSFTVAHLAAFTNMPVYRIGH